MNEIIWEDNRSSHEEMRERERHMLGEFVGFPITLLGLDHARRILPFAPPANEVAMFGELKQRTRG